MPDTKLPSALELKSLFKVSTRTIQHSLNLLEKEGLIKGVRSQGIFVRNTKDLLSYGNLKNNGRISKVGILYPRYAMHTVGLAYFVHIFWGIQITLVKDKIRCYLIETRDKSIPEVFKEINALEINGLICLELENETLQKELEQLKLPLVHLELVSFRSSVPMISANHFQGGELSVRHLHGLGHKKILFLYARKKNDPDTDPTIKMRWQGIQSEAKKAGISAAKESIQLQQPRNEERASMEHILKAYQDCSGIIMACGYMLKTMKSIVENEPAKKNRSVDIVSFDEIDSVPDIGGRPVYFCVWNNELMGQKAVETLLNWNSSRPRIQYLPMYLSKSQDDK